MISREIENRLLKLANSFKAVCLQALVNLENHTSKSLIS